jgi:SAM-dependent methyltransferase
VSILEQPPKKELEDWLFEETGGVVQSGPFKGMNVARDMAWNDGALCPILLGCHEQELWRTIEDQIARLSAMEAPKIVNVGCAEGYYAVGLKRRLPHARVWAIDIDYAALALTAKAAALNEVELKIASEVGPAFKEAPDLIVMDCEGAETVYLNPYMFPLASTHIIVEIHQSEEQDTIKILSSHWHKSHEVWLVWEFGRNPNDYEILRKYSSLMRWLAVCEFRPCQMAWFVMKPKGKADDC